MQRSARLARAAFVCSSCTRHLNGAGAKAYVGQCRNNILRRHGSSAAPASAPTRFTSSYGGLPTRRSYSAVRNGGNASRPFRVAVIGAGPAGFYTAYRLMNKVPNAVVDMYEQLPVPYGLVRFGVAPDHPEVKKCEEKFEEVAKSPRFHYIGNIKVGQDIDLVAMKPHYDAFLFSYGASHDKKLGVPGEDLAGVYSAREFVGWYNGLPQFQGLTPNVEAGEQAVIIGQGNVAMDVARMLLTPVDILKTTDITEQALETLSKSRVTSVKVVGRRGPLQGAFTIKEVRELMNIDQVFFEPIDPSFYPSDLKKLPRQQKRIGEVLLKGSRASLEDANRRWALEFLKAPKSMNADGSNKIASVTFTNQKFVPDADPLLPSARVEATGEEITIPAALAFRSVGYKSTALPGLAELGVPFDTKLGIIPNDPYGRVITPNAGPGELAAGHVAGLYCAGWVKRGPTGVIASTMEDAFTSADIIATDWQSDVPFLNSEKGAEGSTGMGWDALKEQVVAKGVRPLGWNDWKAIDQAERSRGKLVGKSREKFTSVEAMLNAISA